MTADSAGRRRGGKGGGGGEAGLRGGGKVVREWRQVQGLYFVRVSFYLPGGKCISCPLAPMIIAPPREDVERETRGERPATLPTRRDTRAVARSIHVTECHAQQMSTDGRRLQIVPTVHCTL